MKKGNEKSESIRNFILESIFRNEKGITKITADKFGISSQAVYRHVKKLVENGLLEESGFKKGKTYKLKVLVNETFSFKITKELEEHVVWRDYLEKLITEFPRNIYDICSYGVSEMVNNAVDHSEGNKLDINIKINAVYIEITLSDNGIGIFKKIQRELKLDHERYSILELAKGKFTTDPENHSGEGIFFTSRMFDQYSILSGKLFFIHHEEYDDWLFEDVDRKYEGTQISMSININALRKSKDVFEKYSTDQNYYGFNRTLIPVKLLQYGKENLISRSQAKRLLVGFERFKEIVLDFKGVNFIGNAFIDEIFRVYKKKNPDINVYWLNANDYIENIIRNIQRNLENDNNKHK